MEAPHPRKFRRKWLLFLAVPLIAWAIFVRWAAERQRSMIYMACVGLPDPPPGIQRVEFPSLDGVSLVSWYMPPVVQGGPTLLYLQGNGGTIEHRAARLTDIAKCGWGCLMLGYRGYGLSAGQPDGPGLARDARAALAWLKARPETGSVLYFGESLGAAIALDLAVEHPPAAVFLESPFSSLAAVAQSKLPLIPVSWVLRENWDNIAAAGRIRCPLFVAHGTHDDLTPFAQGRAVFDAATTRKQFFEVNAGHLDVAGVGGRAYWDAMRAFVDGR